MASPKDELGLNLSRLYYPRTPSSELDPEEVDAIRGTKRVAIAEHVKPQESFRPGETAKKIAKLIPVEVVTGYAALVSATPAIGIESLHIPFYWIAFFVAWVLTPIYLRRVADADKPSRNQIIVGALAFPIWAYLVSGDQILPENLFDAGLATAIALLFSFVSAVIPMQTTNAE